MYAHYFDLGIMHQTVYNTYKGIQTGDASRILELTNPHQKPDQIKRMAIHNDILLAFFAPFYFIYPGPETLLVIQSVVLALGAVLVFFIAKEVLQKFRYVDWLALTFALSYLLYYPLQKANKFDFHAVTLATTFLLAMYYAFLKKRFVWSTVFAVLTILSKEQVGLTVAFFGGFILNVKNNKKDSLHAYAVNLIVISILWVLLSMFFIIPYFRGQEHFASKYFNYITQKPLLIFYALFSSERYQYLIELLSPLAFISVVSPLHFFIALPELFINLLSSNESMRNTYFHYSSVITPFVFISAIYGFGKIANVLSQKLKTKIQTASLIIALLFLMSGLRSAYLESPLPFGKKADMFPWKPAREKVEDVLYWKEQLKDESLKVASTGQIAPFFTSRRYFYDFSYTYPYADYIILDSHDVQYGFLRKTSYPSYLDLLNDPRYTKIYDRNEIEVYKKL